MKARAALRVEERPNDVLLATLDRPEVANAFDTRTALDLCELFEGLRDEQRCRCIVLTGAGDKAFCAGADLKERSALSTRPSSACFARCAIARFRCLPPSTAPPMPEDSSSSCIAILLTHRLPRSSRSLKYRSGSCRA